MKSLENIKHIAIDMQRLVAEDTAWHSPIVMSVLPNVLRLSTAFSDRTLYARFIAPYNVDEARGNWKRFYRRWPMITGDVLDPSLIELVEPLAQFAKPDQIFDKLGYSIFSHPALDERLRREGIDTLLLSGIETDVCIYSSALAAIDLGYFVIIAADAVASPDEAAHRATLETLAMRLPEQISVLSTAQILARLAIQLPR